MIGGIAVALAAAACYEVGYVLQALEARQAPERHALRPSLIGRLLRRPRWAAGGALALAGAGLQVLALGLAPLSVVQPTLALGLVLLLALGRRVLREPVGRGAAAAVAAIVVGVALTAAAAPERHDRPSSALALALAMTLLGGAVLVPYLAPGGRSRPGMQVAAAAAGDAWAALALKLVSDGLARGRLLAAAAWAAGAAIAGTLALTAEMTALRRRPATSVAPVVLAAQVLVPVALAPAVADESWISRPEGIAVVAGALLVALGAARLGSSRPVGNLIAASRVSETS